MSSLGNFIPSEFDMTPVVANEFIPLIAFNTIVDQEGLKYYFKPSFENYVRKPNTLKNIRDSFEMGATARRIEINSRVFFIAKGVFFSEAGVPLMVCAMKKEAFLDDSVFRFSDYKSDTFSYNNYVLFYSTSFFTDPGLTALNRRLQKEILQACFEKGIEVRMVTSLEIEKNTFARLFEVKKTKSLTQLEAYMEQILPNFLHNEGEDTFVEKEFEPIVIAHEEELSVEDEALLFDNNSTSVAEPIVQAPVIPNRQITLEEAIEMAELAAEATQFDPSSEDFEEDWENDEQDEDEEEMQRHEEAAHTGSGRNVTMHMSQAASERFQEALRAEVNSQLSVPASAEELRQFMSHPAESLVEILRPLQHAYNVQRQIYQDYVMTGAMAIHTDQAIADAMASLAIRRNSIIELIDDTE
jgi:hypothetical protein